MREGYGKARELANDSVQRDDFVIHRSTLSDKPRGLRRAWSRAGSTTRSVGPHGIGKRERQRAAAVEEFHGALAASHRDQPVPVSECLPEASLEATYLHRTRHLERPDEAGPVSSRPGR